MVGRQQSQKYVLDNRVCTRRNYWTGIEVATSGRRILHCRTRRGRKEVRRQFIRWSHYPYTTHTVLYTPTGHVHTQTIVPLLGYDHNAYHGVACIR